MKRRHFFQALLHGALGGVLRPGFAQGTAAPRASVDRIWVDAPRGREVPVRIYVPDDPGPWPLVLFSHGLGGSRAGGAMWGRGWAGEGILAVHLQHPGSDETLWKDRGTLAGMIALKRAMTFENGLLRVGDVRFALDEITRLAAVGDPVFRHADLARVGMSGHSFGARTTITVTSQLPDARIRAAIAFSPMGEKSDAANRERVGRIAIPFLSITGTEDRVPIIDDADPAERQVPFRYMPAPDKYLLVLEGADHMVFNGDPDGRRWSEANREVHAPLTFKVTTAFWKAYLGGDRGARALLADGGMARLIGGAGRWLAK